MEAISYLEQMTTSLLFGPWHSKLNVKAELSASFGVDGVLIGVGGAPFYLLAFIKECVYRRKFTTQ